MTRKISIDQVKAIEKLNPKDRYLHSIKMIVDFEELFILKEEDNNWAIVEVENKGTLLLWSAKEYCEYFIASELWNDCKLDVFSLEYFIEEVIPFANANNILLNIYPMHNKSGFVVTTEEFVRDINIELEWYNQHYGSRNIKIKYKSTWLAFVDIIPATGKRFEDLIQKNEEPDTNYLGAWANVLLKSTDIPNALGFLEKGIQELDFLVKFVDKIENLMSLVQYQEVNENIIEEADWLLGTDYYLKISDAIFPYT